MHIISVDCLGFLTLYLLDDSLVHRMTVETMKMQASTAREAMAMRQWLTAPRVEQGWTSEGPGGTFETLQGAAVIAGVGVVDGIVNLLGKIPAGLVAETAEVEMEEVEMEEVEMEEPSVGDSVGECDEAELLVARVFVVVTGEEVGSDTSEAGLVTVPVEDEALLTACDVWAVEPGDELDVTSGVFVDVRRSDVAEAVSGEVTSVEGGLDERGWVLPSVGCTGSEIVAFGGGCASPVGRAAVTTVGVWSTGGPELVAAAAVVTTTEPAVLPFVLLASVSVACDTAVWAVVAVTSAGLWVAERSRVAAWVSAALCAEVRSLFAVFGAAVAAWLLLSAVEVISPCTENKTDIPHSRRRQAFTLRRILVE